MFASACSGVILRGLREFFPAPGVRVGSTADCLPASFAEVDWGGDLLTAVALPDDDVTFRAAFAGETLAVFLTGPVAVCFVATLPEAFFATFFAALAAIVFWTGLYLAPLFVVASFFAAPVLVPVFFATTFRAPDFAMGFFFATAFRAGVAFTDLVAGFLAAVFFAGFFVADAVFFVAAFLVVVPTLDLPALAVAMLASWG